MKILLRVLLGVLLGMFIWNCDLLGSGPDELNITVPDSLKTSAEKYDSIRLDLVTVKGTDTTLRQVLFHGEYKNPAQLRKMPLVLSYKDAFTVILKGYRKDALVLESHLNFVKGKAGTSRALLNIVPGIGGGNPPIVEGKTPVNTKNPTWTWKSGREGGSGNFRTSYKPDMSAAVSTRERSYTASNLSEGTHTLYVQERDSLGNWSASGLFAVEVDLTPPNRPAMDSTPYSPLNSLRPKWTWKSGGNGGIGTYRVKVDNPDLNQGADTVAEGAYAPGKDLSEALHTVYVQERDAAGNWSAAGERSIVLSLRRIIGNVGLFNGNENNISLALNNENVPFIAYNEISDSNRARVKSFRNGTWEALGNPGSFGDIGGINAFVLDATGIPYLAVQNENDSGKATVVRYIQGKWEAVGPQSFTGAGAGDIAFSLDKIGLPYIAYRDEAKGNRTTIMRQDSWGWDTVGNRGISDRSSIYHHLVFDKSNIPYVAFLGNYDITVMKFTRSSSKWESLNNLGVKCFGNGLYSMTINPKDTLFISLETVESGGAGVALKFNGSTWEKIGEDIYPAGAGNSTTITCDKNGNIFALFQDRINGNRLTLKTLKQGRWINVGPAGFSPALGKQTFKIGFAISAEGVPYVAFLDASKSDKIVVMKTSFDP